LTTAGIDGGDGGAEPYGAPRPVPPKPHPRRESGTRFEEIVDAAAELFSTRGYAATSIQEIADAVGLLKGSLYHYINSKEDLLYAVVQEVHHGTAALGDRALQLPGDAPSRLAYVIDRHLHGAGANLAKLRVFYNESNQLSPNRLSEIVADRDSYEHCIRALIRDGQARGEFAAHLDPALTSIAILAVLNSVQYWFRPDGARSIDDVVGTFTDLILRSVAPVAA
jgi:AcrR family transcriptional regulator